jgi:uncharacterized protein YbjT (DUF2867 family)
MKIAVTGANSSVGLSLLAQLAGAENIDVIAGVRSTTAMQSLPATAQIDARIISYADAAELASSLQGADHVVHLAGILIEDKKTNYASANVDATAVAVAAAQQITARHFVFISVIGADADSSNAYFRSKGEAEKIVRESGLAASIIRTPLLLGPHTAGAQAITSAAMKDKPKALGGGSYRTQPLDIDDLSNAILQCCKNPGPAVTLYELAGPESLSYRELLLRTAAVMGKTVQPGAVPIWLARLGAALASRLRGGGINPTVIDVITADEVIPVNADTALGITLTPLNSTLEKICNGRDK